MVPPKVLVGCPTSDHKAYCLKEYVNALKALTYDHFDVLLVDNSKTDEYSRNIKDLGIPVIKDTYLEHAKDRIVHSRNILRDYVLKHNYDYFLSLEQDVIPPPNIIEQLLHHDKPVVTGVYFKEYDIVDKDKVVAKKILPLLYRAQDIKKEHLFQLSEPYLKPNGLQPIDACGLGCVLIHKTVLHDILFRHVKEHPPFDDMWFCHDALDQGFQLYVDMSVKCKHITKEMDWTTIKK